MKNIQMKSIACALSFASFLLSTSQAKLEEQYKNTFEGLKTVVQKIKQENPFTNASLANIKSEVVQIARSAGCGITDLLVLNSFANRVTHVAEKVPALLSAFGKEFFNNILPKHEDTIIEIMQKPEFAPIQDLFNEQLETLPKLLESQQVTPKSTKSSDVEQKMQKINEMLNGCQGQLHKLMGVLLTIGVYAEALSKQVQTNSYQKLFNDIKTTAIKITAEHLELAEIDHANRFLQSEAYKKLITRYDDLVKVVINSLNPGYYQNTATSIWSQVKSYANNLVAAVA